MRVAFFASDKPREILLGEAFIKGVYAHGDTGEVRPLIEGIQVASDCEVAVMVGVKSRALYQANWQAGVHVIMIDKGYTRHRIGGPIRLWEYWRVAVDGHHPTRVLMNVDRPSDRAKRLNLKIEPWREQGKKILIAGSSAKYHNFYKLSDPTSWTNRLVRAIRRHTDKPILYRPKPSWQGAVEIEHTSWSGRNQGIMDALRNSHVMITHGSNACFEAILAGVPVIVLGDAVAKPISSTDVAKIRKPKLARMSHRKQWLANLMYHQWTMQEFESGEAWQTIRPQIFQ